MKIKNLTGIFAVALVFISSNALADNTLYVLAARQGDLFKTMNRISDMVANVNTTGFKSEADIYSELNTRFDDNRHVSFAKIGNTKRDPSQGSLAVTNRQLDVAISGPGYFMVITPRGERYTRGGNFKINAEGALVTKDNYPVSGPGGGQVEFSANDIDITIREDGLVSVGTEERGQIGVFVFENEQALIKEGQGLYRTNQTPTISEKSKIAQGMLENSNVNSVTAMTDLIEVSRAVETTKQLQSEIHGLQLNSIKSLSE